MRTLLLFFFIGIKSIQAQYSTRLINNWEFLKQDIGGIWEAVRPVKQGNPEDVPLWTKVSLPHCVNAKDAVDPDVNYYQGPSWYRTQLDIQNPYPNGRTLLHFEGAGQKTDVYVYSTKVGSHVGGYDEFTIDITDAAETFKKTEIFQKQFNWQSRQTLLFWLLAKPPRCRVKHQVVRHLTCQAYNKNWLKKFTKPVNPL